MLDELNLAAKPQKKSAKAQAEQAAERAFDRSYRSTLKEVAKAEGAAAGAASSLHAERIEDGVSDRISNLPAICGYRSRGVGAVVGDGADDDASQRRFIAGETADVCAG